MAVIVDEPITFCGLLISTRGSFAVRSNSASDEIMMPGVITPPTYSALRIDRVESCRGSKIYHDAGRAIFFNGGHGINNSVGAHI